MLYTLMTALNGGMMRAKMMTKKMNIEGWREPSSACHPPTMRISTNASVPRTSERGPDSSRLRATLTEVRA